MGGLQQHIIYGLCKSFSEEDHAVADDLDERWLQLMQAHVLALRGNPSDCLGLTRRCQCCKKILQDPESLDCACNRTPSSAQWPCNSAEARWNIGSLSLLELMNAVRGCCQT